MLDFKVENLIISPDKKVEDSLGHTIITKDNLGNLKIIFNETQLAKELKYGNQGKKPTLFVVHNINNASHAILDLLNTIFDKDQECILFPDNNLIKKCTINIICIFNPIKGATRDNKLPQNIIFNSIYYIVQDPFLNDVNEIIFKKLQYEEFKEDYKKLYENYKKTKILIEKRFQKDNTLNLNDISKYIELRKVSYKSLESDIIYAMIFAYRFPEIEIQKAVIEELGLTTLKFYPSIEYDNPVGTLNIIISDRSKIQLKTYFKDKLSFEKKQELTKKFYSLTSNQKNCLIFLALCILSKKTCNILGKTASGKKYTIYTLADLLGKTLHTYQLNSENNLSVFYGQSMINFQITEEERYKLLDIFEKMKNYTKIYNFIKNRFLEINHKKWNGNLFKNLMEIMKEEEKILIDKNDIEVIKKNRIYINKMIQPPSRFDNNIDSPFITYLKNGDFVFFEGINYCNSNISDKLIPFIRQNQEFDLTTNGKANYIFTRLNKENTIKINEEFMLFMSCNTDNQNYQNLDPTLLSICPIFCLPPNDDTLENTAQILYGFMTKYGFDKVTSYNLSSRLAYVHELAKNKSINEGDSFSEEIIFNSRVLVSIGKEIKFFSKKYNFINNKGSFSDINKLPLYEIICNSINFFYLNSYYPNAKSEDNRKAKINEFKNELIKAFEKEPGRFILDQQSSLERNKNIYLILKSIQEYCVGKNMDKIDFDLKNFCDLCLKEIQLNDIETIYFHLNDTVNNFILRLKITSKERHIFHQLNILTKIFYEIKNLLPDIGDQFKSKKLNDPELLKVEHLNKELCKLLLLSDLLEDPKNLGQKIETVIFDNETIEFIKLIMNLYTKKNLNCFENIIKFLNEHPNLFNFIKIIFPFKKYYSFLSIRFISYWILLIMKLYNNNLAFNIKIKEKNYSFNLSNNKLSAHFIFNNKFQIEEGSSIFSKNEKVFAIDKGKKSQLDKWSYIFFYILNGLIENNSSKIELKKVLDLTKEGIKKYENSKKIDANFKSFKLSNFFEENNKSSLLGKAWSIVYNCNKTDLMDYFNIFSYPLESNLINLCLNIFELIEFKYLDDIISITKKMEDFCSKGSLLWQIHTNEFKPDKAKIDYYKTQIKIEEDTLNIILNQKIKIGKQVSDELKKLLIDVKSKIEKIIEDNEKDITKKKFLTKKNEIKKLLDSIKSKEAFINSTKIDFLNMIDNIKDDDLTENTLERLEKNTKFLVNLEKNIFKKVNEKKINWNCFVKTEPEEKKSKNLIILELIIWFSKIISIINWMHESLSERLMEGILKLNSYPELKNITIFLLNIQESKEFGNCFSQENLFILYSTINSFFLMKVLNSNLINEFFNLNEFINSFQKRIKFNEDDFYFVNYVKNCSEELPDDFKVFLPKIQPYDIFYLFLNILKNNGENRHENFALGPMLNKFEKSQTKSKLISMFKDIKEMKYNKMVDCIIDVSIILFNNIFDAEKNINRNKDEIINIYNERLKNNQDSLNNLIKNNNLKQYKNLSDENVIIKEIKLLFSIAEEFDKNNIEYNLSFEDISFLEKNKYLNNNDLFNNYPSLMFYLYSNLNITKNLQINYNGKKLYENSKFHCSFYFWIFILRIFSSINCINFDCYEKYNNYSIQTIQSLILTKLEQKEKIGKRWFNYVFNTIPFELENFNDIQIFQFIKKVLILLKQIDDRFCLIIDEEIKKVLTELFTFILSDNIDDLFKKNLNDNSDLLIKIQIIIYMI